ncbi:glutamine synthetase family protein [Thalassomonas sp. M1454]|uniref:glutamine synthetase family protein n=1 Tax=Thalassomonas sp. M1454 TaxID=2594477 RepID=UPI00117EBE1A|nr:glutamine synthetase family protein [Thalassomonas sp. M1454]TRX57828.1 glutamine synthetase [Thalassomonas sp. M1454]
MNKVTQWLQDNNVEEVQCVTGDHTGISRGKILPVQTFIDDQGFRIAEAILLQAACGDLIDDKFLFKLVDERDLDMVLKPDENACYLLPWTKKPTAMIIHDSFLQDGTPNSLSPRVILQKVLSLYKDKGLTPVVAPEMELYLTQTNDDSNIPLKPPIGRSGRRESGRQSFGIEALSEFSPFVDDIYDWAKKLNLDLDAVVHEEGTAQFEFNLVHGDALSLADQVFVFKRLVKEAATKHGFTATFMAKPISGQPGSAMHIHQSIVDSKTGENIFANEDGDTEAFAHYIGGLQRYTPEVLAIYAPHVNSYRRFVAGIAAPVNIHWGLENRAVGLRVPSSPIQARRVENRLPGADSNPYLAIAATLLCGYLGMEEKIEPTEATNHRANYNLDDRLPLNIDAAIAAFEHSETLKKYLGEAFVKGFAETRKADYENFKNVISSWERNFLLTTV